MPEPVYWDGGLDGRPGLDVAALARANAVEECAQCGHLAPDISFAYPRVAEAQKTRPAVLALKRHAPASLRFIAVANLYGEADPRVEGYWVLRAAWIDESAGFADAARGLRRRSAGLLEDALFQGYALDLERGASSLALSEMFRVGGELTRATEHLARGFAAKPEARERSLLLFEASCIFDEETRPYTRAEARDRRAAWSNERELEIEGRVKELKTPLPAQLRPFRALDSQRASMAEEARVFAQDFQESHTSVGVDLTLPPDEHDEPPDGYTQGARQLMASAQNVADARHHQKTTPVHFLAGLLALTPIQELLRELKADPVRALAAAENELASFSEVTEPSFLSLDAQAMLERASEAAKGELVTLSHLLHACIVAPEEGPTLDDLDKDGLGATIEQQQLNRVIAAGSLDRLIPVPSEAAEEPPSKRRAS